MKRSIFCSWERGVNVGCVGRRFASKYDRLMPSRLPARGMVECQLLRNVDSVSFDVLEFLVIAPGGRYADDGR